MKVYVKETDDAGVLIPTRATTFASGYDIRANLPQDMYPAGITLDPFTVYKIPTGLYMAPEPGVTMLVCSRSGLAAKGVIVVNGPGVIDSDYRGEIMVLLMLCSLNKAPVTIWHGDRIGQLLFVPAGGISLDVDFHVVAELPDPQSNRVGGFGSTGA